MFSAEQHGRVIACAHGRWRGGKCNAAMPAEVAWRGRTLTLRILGPHSTSNRPPKSRSSSLSPHAGMLLQLIHALIKRHEDEAKLHVLLRGRACLDLHRPGQGRLAPGRQPERRRWDKNRAGARKLREMRANPAPWVAGVRPGSIFTAYLPVFRPLRERACSLPFRFTSSLP